MNHLEILLPWFARRTTTVVIVCLPGAWGALVATWGLDPLQAALGGVATGFIGLLCFAGALIASGYTIRRRD